MTFDLIFEKLTGYAPFPWQTLLYQRFNAGWIDKIRFAHLFRRGVCAASNSGRYRLNRGFDPKLKLKIDEPFQFRRTASRASNWSIAA